ncbi:arylamine N-acetyltransferase [Hyphomicrobium sp.]|uniref:arylamine N-acetyltransferase family protein n=1 Tax=Hyphomicrobium sp. TaxID=82 RepID=UPI0025C50B31|nr:arylamine N-acetyltransferase [Hyphomicrobium sp.]MCC7250749.1 arylamine N-acetyltransferase [Hyphomicrobium sp.]
MADHVDIAAYLARIGYGGPTTPSPDTLAALQSHHVEAIAFETLAMVLGERVHLDLPSLQRKILLEGRGGYCFELNLLFLHLLRALGFDARPLTGRVIMHEPEEAWTASARTHVLILVTIDGVRYTVDVGFGGMTPTGPLRLDSEDEQQTPHDPYRLTRRGETYTLRARIGPNWHHYYTFDLAPQADIDFEVGNWYVSTHPASPFRKRLLAARVEPGVRYALRGADYARHRVGAESERRTIENPNDAIALLRTVFRINVPASAELETALASVLAPSATPPP